jgi:hypothetical protein
LPRLAPCRQVVGADVAEACRVRRIAVLREDQGSLRRRIDERDLVLRIDRRDGNRIDAFGQQVIDDPLLLRGGAVRGQAELGLDVRQLLVGLLDAAPGDRPEVGGVVGDEGHLQRPCRTVIAGGRPAPGDSKYTGQRPSGKSSHGAMNTMTGGDVATASHQISLQVANHSTIVRPPNASTPGEEPAKTCGRWPVSHA